MLFVVLDIILRVQTSRSTQLVQVCNLNHNHLMNKTSNKVILIDESGTLPDPDDAVIVVAAVGALDCKKLKVLTTDVRRAILHSKQKSLTKELKFYTSGERTKLLYLRELVKHKVDIFVLVVEKNGQSISDSPENMATLAYILLKECLLELVQVCNLNQAFKSFGSP